MWIFFLLERQNQHLKVLLVKTLLLVWWIRWDTKGGNLEPTECGASLRLSFPSSERHSWLQVIHIKHSYFPVGPLAFIVHYFSSNSSCLPFILTDCIAWILILYFFWIESAKMEQSCFLEYNFFLQPMKFGLYYKLDKLKHFRDCNFVMGKGHKTVRFEIFTAEGSAEWIISFHQNWI